MTNQAVKEVKVPKYEAISVLACSVEEGLTSADVALRTKNGLKNTSPATNTKTEKQIVKENVFTFFNLIFVILALALILVGSFLNLTFLLVAIANTLIGIYQEIRAKRAVDQLTLVAVGSVTAVRNGVRVSVRTDELVRDDIVRFAAGNQICADAVVREGSVQVNESLLTGEADAIVKNPGDELKSGSFVISGHCMAQLTAVGADCYAVKLALEAKKNTHSTESEMMRALSNLIRWVGFALLPLGIVLFLRQFLPSLSDQPLKLSVETTVAALIGMIPEGLYLLTSIAIAVSCLKLSKKRVLIQDMNCIETLAHVDVLCVDKTGTITEPKMEVADIYPIDPEQHSYEQIETILASFYFGEEPDNETAHAMKEQFSQQTEWESVKRIPFSSSNKWSAADFGENGSYIIGAPEFVLKDKYELVRGHAEPWSQRGCRVLLLASYASALDESLDVDEITPIALIFLNNLVRADAADTFRYFASQGVSIRVISGDNPITVSEVASGAGIEFADRYIDCSELKTKRDFEEAVEKYTVFGRVTPEQKRSLIRAFKKAGHTVAMTGDGVNDVLALKEADCGIAMASGSQAASQISQIVLLDSQFSAMPGIVSEGRRVINNIQRAASLFLVKNIFSFTLTLALLFLDIAYPLQPIQLSLISSLTIGIPSFFLALEPNYGIVKGHFMKNVLLKALPGGLTNLCLVLLAAFCCSVFHIPTDQFATIAVWLIATVGFITLFYVSTPFTNLRIVVFVLMLVFMVIALLFFGKLLMLATLSKAAAALMAILMLACPTVMRAFMMLFDPSQLKTPNRDKGVSVKDIFKI